MRCSCFQEIRYWLLQTTLFVFMIHSLLNQRPTFLLLIGILLHGLIPPPLGPGPISQKSWVFPNYIIVAIPTSSGLFSAPGVVFTALSFQATSQLDHSLKWWSCCLWSHAIGVIDVALVIIAQSWFVVNCLTFTCTIIHGQRVLLNLLSALRIPSFASWTRRPFGARNIAMRSMNVLADWWSRSRMLMTSQYMISPSSRNIYSSFGSIVSWNKT